MSDTFEYGGYHFTPHRQFRKGEVERRLAGDSRPWKKDARYAMRNMWSDRAVNLPEYRYEDFYAASTDKNCDIFRCEETGRLYVPGANELFGYREPKQRSREPAQRQSAMEALSKAKETAATAPSGKPKERNGPEL